MCLTPLLVLFNNFKIQRNGIRIPFIALSWKKNSTAQESEYGSNGGRVTDARIISMFKFKCSVPRHKYSMSNRNKSKDASVNTSYTMQIQSNLFSVPKIFFEMEIVFVNRHRRNSFYLRFWSVLSIWSYCHAKQIRFKWRQTDFTNRQNFHLNLNLSLLIWNCPEMVPLNPPLYRIDRSIEWHCVNTNRTLQRLCLYESKLLTHSN